MENIKRIVSALTSLIHCHRERIDAYLSLAETRSHDDIKSLCMNNVDTSIQNISNLSKWRSAYGIAQNLDRRDRSDIWYEAKLFLSFNREKTIISRCEKLDMEILKLYQLAIPLMPSSAEGDLQLQAKTVERMRVKLHDGSEQKQFVGALATR